MDATIKNIPQFPLKLVVLPGERVPLRIFEPRYKQLIKDIQDTDKTFGIPYAAKNLHPFGSEVKLASVLEFSNYNDLIIMVEGVGLFNLSGMIDNEPGKLYPLGKVIPITDEYTITDYMILELLDELQIKVNYKKILQLNLDHVKLSEVVQALDLLPEEKYRFVALKNHYQKEQFVIQQLQYIKALVVQEKKLENNYTLN